MTTEKQAKRNQYSREKVNKEWKMVRIRNNTSDAVKALQEKHELKSVDAVVQYLLGK